MRCHIPRPREPNCQWFETPAKLGTAAEKAWRVETLALAMTGWLYTNIEGDEAGRETDNVDGEVRRRKVVGRWSDDGENGIVESKAARGIPKARTATRADLAIIEGVSGSGAVREGQTDSHLSIGDGQVCRLLLPSGSGVPSHSSPVVSPDYQLVHRRFLLRISRL